MISKLMKKAIYKNSKLPLEDRIQDLLTQMTRAEKLEQVHGLDAFSTHSNKRLGIPGFLMTDGPLGVRWGKATAYPAGVAIGSTWNPELIQEVGVAMARETKAHGRDVLLGPCVNIHRTPLGGRNFESYGEDPFLTSRLAVSYIKGVQSEGVAASIKHFAVNNQETERFSISAEIEETALQEIYLPSFKAAVQEADVWTVMSAYNRINGDFCAQNEHLLKDILKGDWNFRGLVVSDWYGTHDTVGSGNFGLDLEMPGPGIYFGSKLEEALDQGRIPLAELDDKVRRILRVKFLMGLMDQKGPKSKTKFSAKASAALSRRVGAEAMVLLKNNKGNALPLATSKVKILALLGPNSGVARTGGGGSSLVNPLRKVSPLDGLRAMAGRKGSAKKKLKVIQSIGCLLPESLLTLPANALVCDGPDGRRQGLAGEYFGNQELQGTPAKTRIDSPSHLSRGIAVPLKNTGRGRSVRWQARLRVPESGTYSLGFICRARVRLYIDGRLLVEQGQLADPLRVGFNEKEVRLEAGMEYAIKIEYMDKHGSSEVRIKLGWKPGWDMVQKAVEAAREASVSVVCVGMAASIETEGVDQKSMSLPEGQNRLIQEVAKVSAKTIVVVYSGVPVDMEPWLDQVEGVIQAWYPGQEGGHVLADILFGRINPSGKLPATFPKKYQDSPSANYYPGKDGKVRYGEGLFVGYRYFDSKKVKPLFPFGFGLSYTTFRFSNLEADVIQPSPRPIAKIKVQVQNTGARAGHEVIQIYVGRTEPGSRPVKELKRFKKIFLEKGQRKTLVFELDKTTFSAFDPKRSRWALHPGEYKIYVGNSSRDIHLTSAIRI